MDLPAPVHLVLSSQYFVHLLSWKMGPSSPDGVHYTVSVHALKYVMYCFHTWQNRAQK